MLVIVPHDGSCHIFHPAYGQRPRANNVGPHILYKIRAQLFQSYKCQSGRPPKGPPPSPAARPPPTRRGRPRTPKPGPATRDALHPPPSHNTRPRALWFGAPFVCRASCLRERAYASGLGASRAYGARAPRNDAHGPPRSPWPGPRRPRQGKCRRQGLTIPTATSKEN